jgi:hypothetical protein
MLSTRSLDICIISVQRIQWPSYENIPTILIFRKPLLSWFELTSFGSYSGIRQAYEIRVGTVKGPPP